jgi:hypothetical protein
MPAAKTFKGTDNKGNLQKALDAAIRAALKSAPGADPQVEWTLKDVSGLDGGFAGIRQTTVTIKARVS